MNKISQMLLEALKSSLTSKKVSWEEVSSEEWNRLFIMAQKHQVLPLVYESVYDCPAAKNGDPELFRVWKSQVIHSVMIQSIKTEEFINMYQKLSEAGIRPQVVKGIICRKLYPSPDHRVSGDEDILVSENDFMKFHEEMLRYGMELVNPSQDLETEHEITYGKKGSPIMIEAHKTLFPPQSEAYGEFNRYFEKVWEDPVSEEILGSLIDTIGYTEHLFYLICHAFKHFLHSGFGIRQVCDIILFANAHGKETDWDKIIRQCREIRGEKFAAAVFEIGRKYLVFDPQKAAYPSEWSSLEVDESLLLNDLLESGIFGDASMSRKHSSNITLHAVGADKRGKSNSFSMVKTVFPSADSLKGRYGYLEKRPYLLPVAWAQRMLTYQRETQQMANNQAMDAVKIGNQRIELLKYYDILKS